MVVKYPLLSEKAMDLVEEENKMVFVVNKDSNKKQIKEGIEDLYDIKITKVNTQITSKGEKRAYVKLSDEDSAMDLATELNLI